MDMTTKTWATISARIDKDLKKEVEAFLRARGLKVQSFVERLFRDALEDEEGRNLIESRRHEARISHKDMMTRVGWKKG